MRWLPFLLLLTGCSLSHEARLDTTLNRYAQLAFQSGDLGSVLRGEALLSAERSQKLMQDLKLTQQGVAVFSVQAASSGVAKGCVDLSGVSVVDSKGEILKTNGGNLKFTAAYDLDFFINNLQIADENC
jgi:hypothetical protein